MTAFAGFLKFKNCYIRITLRITGLHFTGFLKIYGIFKLLLYFTGLCFERTVACLYFMGLSLRDYILQDLSILWDYK